LVSSQKAVLQQLFAMFWIHFTPRAANVVGVLGVFSEVINMGV